MKDGFLDNSFYNNKSMVWLAPPQGLMLNRVTFEAYNKKKDIPESLELKPEEVSFVYFGRKKLCEFNVNFKTECIFI